MKTDILILSKNMRLASTAIASICKNVDKKSVGKIVIGWTGPSQPAEQDISMFGFDITLESLDHYNFAQNNNYLVERHCFSECVLFMNDDVELVEDSVTKCMKWLEDQSVGTVGIKLLYPNKTIQHCGQFVSIQAGYYRGCGHIYWKQPDRKMPAMMVVGNTGAFLMMRKADFLKVGGFNEKYVHCLEDVELNLNILKLGKNNVCDASTWAWHAESQTRKQANCQEDTMRLKEFVERNLCLFMQRS